MSGGLNISMKLIGADTVQNKLRHAIHMAPKGAERAARKLGPMLVAKVRENSDAAGIQVITGQYLASIQAGEVIVNRDGASVSVGSSAPQALRLEYGFMDVDALGRHYAQPPFPHWRPSMNWLATVAPQEVFGAVLSEMKLS